MDYITIPWELITFGLPHRRARNGLWVAKSGMRLQGTRDYDPPFGRARNILLYFAAKAERLGRVFDGSFDELKLFGNWRDETIEQHLLSVAACTYSVLARRGQCCDAGCPTYHRLDFVNLHHYCPENRTFRVELGDGFVSGLRDSPRCPFDTLQAFMSLRGMAPLDLFAALCWKLHRGDYATVDAFGPHGPYSLLTTACHDRKRAQTLRDTYAVVQKLWPACPFHLIDTRIVHESALTRPDVNSADEDRAVTG